jgi:hypothetical protein
MCTAPSYRKKDWVWMKTRAFPPRPGLLILRRPIGSFAAALTRPSSEFRYVLHRLRWGGFLRFCGSPRRGSRFNGSFESLDGYVSSSLRSQHNNCRTQHNSPHFPNSALIPHDNFFCAQRNLPQTNQSDAAGTRGSWNRRCVTLAST